MNRRKSFEAMEKKIKNIIIAAAYNDVSFLKKRRVRKLISENSEAKKLFDENKKIADSLHLLKTETCPDEIVRKAKNKIFISHSKNNFTPGLFLFFIKKPAVTFAVSLSVMLIISLAVFTNKNNTKIIYTPQQITAADVETKQAFKIIGRIFKSSQQILESNILGKQIGCPIKTGIKEINNLFNSGG